MSQAEEGPEQRESDLFSVLLVDNYQFKSLMFIFIANYLAAAHP